MISLIAIQNFKCFSGLWLQPQPLTLLTGFNGGGKSTALQPLLLAAQGVRSINKEWPLNGTLVRLGSCAEVLPRGTSSDEMKIHIETVPHPSAPASSASSFERTLFARASNVVLPKKTRQPSKNKGARWSEQAALEALRTLSFLGPARLWDATNFPEQDCNTADVGVDGRFAPSVFYELEEDQVEDERQHPELGPNTVRRTLNAYLDDLFPAAEADVTAIPEFSSVGLGFRLSTNSNFVRPANMGYGLSYVFPILVALLTAKKDTTLIFDSPEAHLHPSAQSKMGEILARFAAAGLQIIVETHSDHLLNGARLAVKNGLLSPDNVSILFFSRVDAAYHGVTALRLDRNGSIEDWPAGFFDQAEKDLVSLANW